MSNQVIRHGDPIKQADRADIAKKRKTITRVVNKAFRGRNDDTGYSFYVGSYGRHTAISSSDVDLLVELPMTTYGEFMREKHKGQSMLLKKVSAPLQRRYRGASIYPHVYPDGQVVVIEFSNRKIEVLPSFGTTVYGNLPYYIYPDTNGGGKWKSTDPKSEIEAMREKDRLSGGLLCDTCRHVRYMEQKLYGRRLIPGIVIDSAVYMYIGDYRWDGADKVSITDPRVYEYKLAMDLNNVAWLGTSFLCAPGSNDQVVTDERTLERLVRVLDYMAR